MDEQSFTGNEIAVIGMSGRFPKSYGMKEYWDNIIKGRECITYFNDQELRRAGVSEDMLNNMNYVKAYGYMEGTTKFENEFFQYTERDALLMDPQMRLVHEVVWETLEDAGYNTETYKKKIGLYLGAADNLYWQVVSTDEDMETMAGNFATSQINNKDYLATQIAYKMNLTGPAVTMSSACSTSLVTIHVACEALLAGDCNIALAGGVAISLPDKTGYLYEEGMILSPDGHCRAFDANSSGTVGGNGVGIVALKLLEDAIRDRDSIHAVIRGTAINNDGGRKIGYSAPSVEGQSEVIRMAQRISNVSPESISYIEAHGTATRIGDPVEVEALKQAFHTNKKQFCAIGSVKSNIGHTDIAAGMAGLLKAILMLENRMIPPAVNFRKLSPQITLENSPFYINTEAKAYDKSAPFRIGVSSFGIGGTNAHVVLEQAEGIAPKEKTKDEHYQSFVFSAKDRSHLVQILKKYQEYLNKQDTNLSDIAYTLATGRKQMEERISFVAKEKRELIREIVRELEKHKKKQKKMLNPKVVFMFPGQGSQYVNMGADLFERFSVFRDSFQQCVELATKFSGKPYQQILNTRGECLEIYETDIAQVYIFSFEYALARLLLSFGIEPSAMIGHSLGEYVAACLAGVLTLEDTIYLIIERGRLMKQLQEGAMLSVKADVGRIRKLVGEKVSIACINSKNSIVLSGRIEVIEQVKQLLDEQEIPNSKLHTLRAFHSEMMETMLEEFKNVLKKVQFHQPKHRYISCFTGTWMKEEDLNPDYWCRQLRNTVIFEEGIHTILSEKNVVFLEVGPGTTLTSFVHDMIEECNHQYKVYNLVRHIKEELSDDKYLLEKIGELWENGIGVDWNICFTGRERKVSLPVYPFSGKEFSINKNPFELVRNASKTKTENQKAKMEEWMYLPSFYSESIAKYQRYEQEESTYLVFGYEDNFSDGFIQYLKSEKKNVVIVMVGEQYRKWSEKSFTIRPDNETDYEALWNDLNNQRIKTIIHMWNVTEHDLGFTKMQTMSLYSLLYIARYFVYPKSNQNLSLVIVANGLLDITGSEALFPRKGAILGAVKVVQQENSSLSTKVVDVDFSQMEKQSMYEMLLLDSHFQTNGQVVAYRKRRWVQSYEQVKISERHKGKIKEEDTIIITGGMGNLGSKIGAHLFAQYHCRIVFFVHRELPIREEWNEYLKERDESDKGYQFIKMVNQLEKQGANVLVISVDITNQGQVAHAISLVESKFGGIIGIIHTAGRTDINVEESLIGNISKDTCCRLLDAKVLGAEVISQCIENKELKFCILFSSLASVIGGYGFFAYSAANSYLDLIAADRNKKSKTRWISVNWDNWNVKENDRNPLGIEIEEGLQVLDWLFTCKESQVLVSTYSLKLRVERWITCQKEDKKQKELMNINLDAMEEQHGDSDIDTVLKEIMEIQLGKKEIDIDDNFFALGGDSLKALSIIAIIQKRLHKKITLSEFFQYPSIREMAQVLSNDEQKKEIPHVNEKEYYRICPAQERLYILNQMHKESLSYNLPQMMYLNGNLDTKMFVECIYQLAERHEALRTSFHYIENQVLQKIHKEVSYEISYMELEEEEAREQVQKFIRPFSLEKPGAFRIMLIKTGVENYIFLFDCHHIISDGGTFKIFFEELAELYQGKQLPKIPLRYRDVCEFEHSEEYLKSIEKQENFWLGQLKGELPILSIPTDYLRKEELNFDGTCVELYIGEELSQKINQYVTAHNTTKFVFFLTVYNVLLSKLSNQKDIIIGTPVARRSNPEIQNVFGHFLNVLPLRNYPDNHKTFEEFLMEVSENTVGAFENEDVSFQSLVEQLHVKWNRNRNPLFDTMIIMQNIESNICNIPDVKVTSVPFEGNSSKFDMTLEIFENQSSYKLVLEFCTELYGRQTMENYLQYMKTIIETILDRKECRIADIKLSKKEKQRKKLSLDFNF